MMFKKTLFLCVLVAKIVSGCASMVGDSKPVPAYSGPERSPDQVAIFKCGWGMVLNAIDGDPRFTGRPLKCSYALLPGRHAFRVGFGERNETTMTSIYSKKDYIVTLDLVAGRTYSLNAFLKENPKDPMPWRVTLSDSSRKELINVTTVREAP